jgi:hypothetical protein
LIQGCLLGANASPHAEGAKTPALSSLLEVSVSSIQSGLMHALFRNNHSRRKWA